MRLCLCRVLLLLVIVMPSAARAATIDFGNFVNNDFDPGETYTEDGFTFSVLTGFDWGVLGVGNPPSGLVAGNEVAIVVGDTISITRNGGGFFTFDAFDFSSGIDGLLTDGLSFVGLVNGIQTAILLDVTSSTTTWVTQDPLFGAAIDELQLVGTSQHNIGLNLDNFVLTPPTEPAPVPEPASLTLLGLGLTGIAGRRWRQRKAS